MTFEYNYDLTKEERRLIDYFRDYISQLIEVNRDYVMNRECVNGDELRFYQGYEEALESISIDLSNYMRHRE